MLSAGAHFLEESHFRPSVFCFNPDFREGFACNGSFPHSWNVSYIDLMRTGLPGDVLRIGTRAPELLWTHGGPKQTNPAEEEHVRNIVCDYCNQPIEKGDAAATGFEVPGPGVMFRVRIEGEPGKPLPDLHVRCARAAIGASNDVLSIRKAGIVA